MSEQQAHCKGCGKPIVWADIANGKKIPLDPRPAIYHVELLDGKQFAIRAINYMVTHFATCPRANDFSASKKPAALDEPGGQA